jgi:LPXTG-motif cell wall-anchored protein
LDINVGNDYSPCYSNCVTPVLFAGQIFFVAYDGSSNQVWTTDGTTAGTVAVTTFEDEYPVGDQSEASLVVAGDNLFFGVTDESLGEMALYKIASTSTELANTGSDVRGIALGALGAMALVALGGALVIARRRNAQV